jgi:hypothetical protein
VTFPVVDCAMLFVVRYGFSIMVDFLDRSNRLASFLNASYMVAASFFHQIKAIH